MSRNVAIACVLVLVAGASGCKALEGRKRNREGNRAFREMQFSEAAANYEKATHAVEDPTLHYNLGLAYSKVFKPGFEGDVLLDIKGTFICDSIPNTKALTKQVCIKEGNRTFTPCDEKNVCASSYKCEKVDLCAIDDAMLADLSAQHFGKWLDANPTDLETRGLMTQVWMDSSQYKKAIDYWQALLDKKPNDPDIIGALGGINLKAGDWRKSIEWYNKLASVATDKAAKVSAYQFIGNVAWSKLNSKTLSGNDSVELADRGIGALQKAAELQPDNPKPFGLMASIFTFRGASHGASLAGALDRATAQDLQHVSRVLKDKAKKAEGAAPTTPQPAPAKSGG